MTLENAKVLHAYLKKIGRTADLASIEKRYPELAKPSDPPAKKKKESAPPEKKSLLSRAKEAIKK